VWTVAENEGVLAVGDEVLNGTLVRVVGLFWGCDCVAPLVLRDGFLQFCVVVSEGERRKASEIGLGYLLLGCGIEGH
jgi:hypothetical protein